MSEAKLLVRVFDGARKTFEDDVLISLFDGAQRRVHWAYHSAAFVEFTIPVTNGPLDVFRVVAGAKDYRDAGQLGVFLKGGAVSVVDLMLLPKRGNFVFQPLEFLTNFHHKLISLIRDFLMRQFNASDQNAYERLQKDNPEGLATLLSIASGFEGFGANEENTTLLKPPTAVKSHPFDFVNKLIDLKPDRFFAEASSTMVTWLFSDHETFSLAPHSLHPGSFLSFKEQRYPEGNVQFTFAKTNNEETYQLDSDIDLFKDQASHFFLEVLPSDFLHVIDHTDPRDAYAFRWMSVQRMKVPSGLDFNPPYSVVPA